MSALGAVGEDLKIAQNKGTQNMSTNIEERDAEADEGLDKDIHAGVVEQASAGDDLMLTRFFNRVGDLFSKMVRGIFVFAFRKLPVVLWRAIFNQKLFRLIRSIARMLFWICIWVVVVFASWLVIDIDKFKRFWIGVFLFCWKYIDQLLGIMKIYANEIWIAIALLGSVYGLLYVPAKFAWRFWKKRREAKVNANSKTL